MLVNKVLQSFGYNAKTGDLFVEYDFKGGKRTLSFNNFPCSDFYYKDHNDIESIFVLNEYYDVYKNSIGIHWYGGHPLAQEYNNKVNEENYKEFDCTISTAIKNVLEKKR